MKCKTTLVVTLLLTFILGFFSLAQAQTDANFKAWLAGLNGSIWTHHSQGDGGPTPEQTLYLKLQSDIITHTTEFTHSGKVIQLGSAQVKGRRVVLGSRLYEISEDGLEITLIGSDGGRGDRYLKQN